MKATLYFLVYPLLILLSLLPSRLFYSFVDFSYLLVYKIYRYRIRIVRKNLRLALKHLSELELLEVEKQFYKNFCDVMFESIRPLMRSSEWTSKKITFENLEQIKKYEDSSRSVIVLLGHYGSWENSTVLSKYINSDLYVLYSPIRNKYFNRMMKKVRSKYGCSLISRYQFAKFFSQQEKNHKNGIYLFVNDQSPRMKKKNYHREFLGQKVPVHTGAERIAKLYDVPVFFMAVNRIHRGQYKAKLILITDSPREYKANQITDIYTQMLEEQIRNDPSQYFWTHNRFKYATSNVSKN